MGKKEFQTRPLKFRAWVKAEKKMLYWGKDFVSLNDDGSIECSPFMKRYSSNESVVTQFTGLQDAKGIDVYEGDIIQHNPRLKVYRMVVFSKGEYLLINDNTMTLGIDAIYTSPTSYQEAIVVGNIFENPELIDYGKLPNP